MKDGIYIKILKNTIRIIIFIIIIEISSFSHNEILFQHLNVENGLSQNGIYSIIQDEKGLMWFGVK
jgi:hypothetical protein